MSIQGFSKFGRGVLVVSISMTVGVNSGWAGDYTPPALRDALPHEMVASTQVQSRPGMLLPKGEGCPLMERDTAVSVDLDEQDSLADSLMDGFVFHQDYKQAIGCYQASAYAGSAYAQFMMSIFHQKGVLLQQDLKLSDRYYRAALSSTDHIEASWEVASRFLDPQAAIYDPTQAEAWLEHAASQGHIQAQDNLGEYYEMGQGHQAPDSVKAVNWYGKAAMRGFPAAQYHLGQLLLKGSTDLGVEPTEAVGWIKKSALQGYPAAQLALARFYSQGQYLEQNWAEAYAWWQMGKPYLTAPDLEGVMVDEMKTWTPKMRRAAIRKANDYRFRYSMKINAE